MNVYDCLYWWQKLANNLGDKKENEVPSSQNHPYLSQECQNKVASQNKCSSHQARGKPELRGCWWAPISYWDTVPKAPAAKMPDLKNGTRQVTTKYWLKLEAHGPRIRCPSNLKMLLPSSTAAWVLFPLPRCHRLNTFTKLRHCPMRREGWSLHPNRESKFADPNWK